MHRFLGLLAVFLAAMLLLVASYGAPPADPVAATAFSQN